MHGNNLGQCPGQQYANSWHTVVRKANDVLHEGSNRQLIFVVIGHHRSAAYQDMRLRIPTSGIDIHLVVLAQQADDFHMAILSRNVKGCSSTSTLGTHIHILVFE